MPKPIAANIAIKSAFCDYLELALDELKKAGPSQQSVTMAIYILGQADMDRSVIAQMLGVKKNVIQRWAHSNQMPADDSFPIKGAHPLLIKLLEGAIAHHYAILKKPWPWPARKRGG